MGVTPAAETGCEVIKPPKNKDLRRKVRELDPREAAKFDPVKAAEEALQRLSGNFGPWMVNEITALQEAVDILRQRGANAATVDAIYQCAHNIKGQAPTLGYPLIGSVAACLCFLIQDIPAPEQLPVELVVRHVEAMKAMVSEGARDADNATGTALLAKLTEVADDYIRQLGQRA